MRFSMVTKVGFNKILSDLWNFNRINDVHDLMGFNEILPDLWESMGI
jgi:hypothetical protein